jgi:class 3 adenylate cyclase/tetratricopeptide (TPR) repeat protein
MPCPRCRADNPPGMRFCGQCAGPLPSICASCGASNPPENRYCGQCAASLDRSARLRFAAPESYTPQHLAERILVSKAALEGERKQVTVLFADLKGSMELLADRDPEEARRILDPVLERMMEAVHRYEGTVNQVMGDGIMALFGAPLAHEDHAVRACYAALRMQESIVRYAAELRRTQGVDVQIRIGLNSGDVVVRSIGSDLRMDYTAVGQTTHLAARMEQLARPGTTFITADTLRLAEGYVEVSPIGPVPVKGLSDPVEVYEVIGAGGVQSRLAAAAARGLSRFVGREAELGQLHRAFERARGGRGQLFAVVGEPGVGKSRLFYEFTRSARMQGWLLVEASSVSYGGATGYLPIIGLLQGYFGITPRDDQKQMREKVIGKLFALDRALEPALPALLALLDIPTGDAVWDGLAPLQRRQRTLDAIKRLLLRESQAQPVCVVIEDLHWIDGETQAVLDLLVESLPSVRVLVLVNYRPEYQHGWAGKTYSQQLRMDPLEPENADELLSALLGDDPLLAPLKQTLVQRTEGNPFFLEESVRTLIEAGALSGERGRRRLVKTLDQPQVPATVQAVLAARIDRLPSDDKGLLQVAAVIGKDVPFPLLHVVSGQPEAELQRRLATLRAAEFLYETRLFPDVEYTFKHALTHEVAYGGLLQTHRRALHARIVDGIEALYVGRVTEQVERLAHHAVRGERWASALGYLEQAGARAFQRSAHQEAAAYLEQSITVLAKLPDGPETLRRGIDLRLSLRNSLFPLGEMNRLGVILREAQRSALVLDDRTRLARTFALLAHFGWSASALKEGHEAVDQALAHAAKAGDQRLDLVARFYLGQLLHAGGHFPRAIDVLTQTIERLEAGLRHDRLGMAAPVSIFARTWLAFCLAETGAFDAALVRAREALSIGEETDHPYGIYHGHVALGAVYSERGDRELAIASLERGLGITVRANMPGMIAPSACHLGHAYNLAGRAHEAASVLEKFVELDRAKGRKAFLALGTLRLGEACRLAGRDVDAMRWAEEALALAVACEQRGVEARARLFLGAVADDERAAVELGLAMNLARGHGMGPLVAHCHLARGKLARRAGQSDQAREHFSTASTMYREMDMPFWLETAETEMG